MTQTADIDAAPDFEIDHPDDFAPYFLDNPREIALFLDMLSKRGSIVTAHLNDGRQFFLTSILAVDTASGTLLLDPPRAGEDILPVRSAQQVTLVGTLEKVKLQLRLPALQDAVYEERNVLSAPIPERLLRLQRREYFRLEPPHTHPILCTLSTTMPSGAMRTLELPLSNISGGGVSLVAPTDLAERFPRDALFKDCRLEIPEEGVIQVNLRVRKTIEISPQSGHRSLRVGCEYIGLPASRLAMIERYITRIERERKARDSGLAD
jgi:c-di-GMP-binding flagellar brake protein YcgR